MWSSHRSSIQKPLRVMSSDTGNPAPRPFGPAGQAQPRARAAALPGVPPPFARRILNRIVPELAYRSSSSSSNRPFVNGCGTKPGRSVSLKANTNH